MKLSEIVAFKNQLDLLPSIESIKLTAEFELIKIKYVLEAKDVVPLEQLQELIKNKNNLQHSFDQLDSTVSTIKNYVKKIIAQEEISYYEDSFRFYKQSVDINIEHGYAREDDNIIFVDSWGITRHVPLEVKTDHKNRINNEILSRNLNVLESAKNTIVSRILSYADWHYPAAIIRPGCEDFINHLVANDPLYLIDEHNDLLLPAMNKFNQQYQNRLRPYVIDESTSFNTLSGISFVKSISNIDILLLFNLLMCLVNMIISQSVFCRKYSTMCFPTNPKPVINTLTILYNLLN